MAGKIKVEEAVRLAKDALGEAPAADLAAWIATNLGMTVKPVIVTVIMGSFLEKEQVKQIRLKADPEPPVVLLRVEGIKPPKDTKLTFEVFLTKKGEKPSKKSYVGPISFFGRRGEHAHDQKEGFTQGFDVTSLIQKLSSANKGKLPNLEVSIIPHSTVGLSDVDLAKKDVEIPISNITLKPVTVEKK